MLSGKCYDGAILYTTAELLQGAFVMAFPFQKQEAFFEGHNQAFRFFCGVPKWPTYDNKFCAKRRNSRV